ncbi:MAG: DNA polymerase III subunit beta [Muribaculaceae bacterium]|nr:DNA polymerase III subunit beta [Muribaculaceae bacterium]
MKFNVSSKALHNAASAVSKVINSKNTITVLDNFLLSLSGDTLLITGMDSENSLTARVAVTDADGEGRFCINARSLVDFLKEIPDQGITFDINPSTLEIKIDYSNGISNFVAVNGDEYPVYKSREDNEEPIEFECPTEEIIKGLDYTMFAASTDEYRPVMQGVFFDIKPDAFTFAATDTRKLVRYITRRVQAGSQGSCIMPMKACSVLKNVFGKDETVKVVMTSKNATFSSATYTFKCCLLNGRYPDYNRVIPANNPYTLTVDRRSLLTAVRRVGVFVDPGYSLEKFRIGGDTMIIKGDNKTNQSTAREHTPCSFDGPDLTIGFSSIYLLEILNVLPTDDITVALADPGRPGVFRPMEDEKDTELLMLLMPMTVTDF